MRFSAKTNYGLAALVYLASSATYSKIERPLSLLAIAEHLDISKIYLEQIFSLLKRAKIVNSEKGAQGGYMLARPPSEIDILEIVRTLEQGIFEEQSMSKLQANQAIAAVLQDTIFRPLDEVIERELAKITLGTLIASLPAEAGANMFFI